ncbi:carnosine N-methyltransferase [Pelomyxa schiedti]|nr:carnosine N-methyltransferase [Pelomyxa schiedti]
MPGCRHGGNASHSHHHPQQQRQQQHGVADHQQHQGMTHVASCANAHNHHQHGNTQQPQPQQQHHHHHVTDEQPQNAQSAEEEEEAHFNEVVCAFLYYLKYNDMWLCKCERDFEQLPPKHKALVPQVQKRFTTLRELSATNQTFLETLVSDHTSVFQNKVYPRVQSTKPVAPFHMEKVKTTLCQFARDWSVEGRVEREACYNPIISEILERFPSIETRNSIRILTPGAGLGRLTFELAAHGFYSQGNEFSYFMLLGSHLILNKTTRVDEFSIFPYIRQSSNVVAFNDQIRRVTVPDVLPSDALAGKQTLSMVAGDFIEVYSPQREQWDCLATCFFLDTAHNIIEYVEIISTMLKPGGLWVNIGPLLYHYADMEWESSVELTWEEVRSVILAHGFTIEKENRVNCPYTSNSKSLLRVCYECIFFVAVKPMSQPQPQTTTTTTQTATQTAPAQAPPQVDPETQPPPQPQTLLTQSSSTQQTQPESPPPGTQPTPHES